MQLLQFKQTQCPIPPPPQQDQLSQQMPNLYYYLFIFMEDFIHRPDGSWEETFPEMIFPHPNNLTYLNRLPDGSSSKS